MIIFPAIDIMDGTPVRLLRGDFDTAEQVAEDVLTTAKQFARVGCTWVHMVDLDGSLQKKPVNTDPILQVVEHTPLKVEVGGGIRTMEDIAFYLDRGVDRVILGSVALKNPELVQQAVDAYGDKIAVGIDAKQGMVATEGWTEDSQMDFIDLAKAMEKMGVATIIYTDIGRDGTLSGPDVQGLDRLNKAVGCNVIASGGVTTITDILVMKDKKMYGTICGKCIYKKTLDLREAVGICK
ncbi:MAG: 1-(5-phosphoribosyl)-5-[(5-phosphoribosylamino)methylideneamino]imidazole-4-carboxamide isomerase [Oscillospiraceae bacterium]|jgi:phosphoribosylformimino-5-aminoimidazole carboxamide ribotide isomerase|nr:MAG: 1-(5-phosphoribosyl)-5-[(5-phosphoribosylamino)methylideneamino]imidazole-4-carboxamide isomerase [Oscillospiraceae bacterium]